MARIKNSNVVDIPIEVSHDHHHMEATIYSHPSYGMISVSRRSGSGEGVPLFGAKNPSTSFMNLKISQADNTQSLGRNWYHANEVITVVEMTPVQYAELISNPNTEGVPCTIKYTNKLGRIEYKPHATEVEYLDTKIEDALDTLSKKLYSKKLRAKELLTQKGTLKKADKEELLSILLNIDGEMSGIIPFYKQCMKESIENMVMEANSDIESLVANVQTKLGKALLERPEAIQLLLEDKGEE